jgi:hypothetical protein
MDDFGEVRRPSEELDRELEVLRSLNARTPKFVPVDSLSSVSEDPMGKKPASSFLDRSGRPWTKTSILLTPEWCPVRFFGLGLIAFPRILCFPWGDFISPFRMAIMGRGHFSVGLGMLSCHPLRGTFKKGCLDVC